MGDALREALGARPIRRATVLCGHTHGAGKVDVPETLHVRTGGARYGRVALQRIVEVD